MIFWHIMMRLFYIQFHFLIHQICFKLRVFFIYQLEHPPFKLNFQIIIHYFFGGVQLLVALYLLPLLEKNTATILAAANLHLIHIFIATSYSETNKICPVLKALLCCDLFCISILIVTAITAIFMLC